jgi:hypothetical protein
MAIKLNGVACESLTADTYFDAEEKSNVWKMVKNTIICGGFKRKSAGDYDCYYFTKAMFGILTSRCKMSQADFAFMFLTAVVAMVAVVLGFWRLKRGY